MIADKKRTLLPGTSFDALIPRSAGKMQVLRNGATTDHTIKTVQSVVRSTLEQTSRLASELKGRDLRDTCSKIWHFVYQHIQYKNDEPGYEQVRHPSRIWADRKHGVDCDDYTVFVSSILLNLGLPHKLRVTDYGRGWQHIYVVVPKSGRVTTALDQQHRDEYIVIDCVPNDFDFEVKYTRKMDIPMQLQVLSGLNGVNGPDYGIDGYNQNDPELGNIFKKVGGFFKKAGDAVAKVAKKVVASPVRAGVLVYMKMNIKQGASRLRWGYFESYNQAIANAGYGPKAYEQIRSSLKKLQTTYVSLGGRPDALRGAILNSSGNKDKAVPIDSPDVAGLGELAAIDPDVQVMQQIDSMNSTVSSQLFGVEPDGLGVVPAVGAATLIAAATPIVVPIIALIAKAKTNDPNDPIPAEYLPEEPESEPAVDTEPTQPDPAVEGLGAVAKKRAKKVAAVVAKKKPALVAKATAKTVQRAGGKPVTKLAPKPAAKPNMATKAQKKALVKSVVAKAKKKKVATGLKVAAGAAAVTAIAPIVRPIVVPDSTLPAMPTTLPTVTDETGAEQVVMPTAPTATKAAKKQSLISRIFKKKQAKTGKPVTAKATKPAQKQTTRPVTSAASTTPSTLPAVTVRPRPAATPVPDTDESDYDTTTNSVSAEQVNEAITQTANTAAQVVKQQKVAAVLKRAGKVSAAVQQVVKAASPATTDDSSVVDATAETEAQATAAANAAEVAIPDDTSAPKQAGFFSTTDGKPNWFNIGIAGAGVYVLSQLLTGKESAERHPRSPGGKSKGLSGTGKRKKRGSRKRRSSSLAGLEAVPLS